MERLNTVINSLALYKRNYINGKEIPMQQVTGHLLTTKYENIIKDNIVSIKGIFGFNCRCIFD